MGQRAQGSSAWTNFQEVAPSPLETKSHGQVDGSCSACEDFPTVSLAPRTWVDVLTIRGAVGGASRRAPLPGRSNLHLGADEPVRRPRLSSRMNTTVFVTFWLIVLARILDVSLDTIRMVSVIQGRRGFAALLGFCEAVVYICAVAKVLLNMNQPVYAIAYGLGFAAGTYLGMVIEQRLAFGKQLVFLLTAKGPELAEVLRAGNYHVAEVKGRIREGDRTIVCVEIARRDTPKLISLATAVDETCAFTVHDIRLAGLAMRGAPNANPRKRSWRFPLEELAALKRSIS